MPNRSNINRTTRNRTRPRRLEVEGRTLGPTLDLPNELPDPEFERIIEAPFPRRDTRPTLTLAGSRSIYMNRDWLNRNSQVTPSRTPENLSGVNSIIPINFGATTIRALPFKTVQNLATNPRFVVLYRLATNHYGTSPVAVDSFLTVWIDGREYDVSASPVGSWFSGPPLGTNGLMALYAGDGVQNVSTNVATYIPGYTDSLANYGILALLIDSRAVGTRIPQVDVELRGVRMDIYTTTFPYTVSTSGNPANWLAWWIKNVEGRQINDASFEALALVNDTNVPGGGKRRTGGISINRGQRAEVVRELLRFHAGTFLVDTGGEIVAIPDRPASSVKTIDGDLLVGPTRIEGPRKSQQPSDVVVIWPDRDTRLDQRARATGTKDGQVTEIRMDGVTNAERAKREAIEIYNRLTVEGDVLTARMRNEGLELDPGDVFTIEDGDVGLAAGKEYRVTQMIIPAEPGEWEIKATEYQASRYSDSIATDPLIGDTDLDNAAEPPAITGLTLTPQNEVTAEAGVDSQMKISWTAPGYAFAALILVEVINNDVAGLGTRYYTAPPDVTEIVAEGLQGDTEYEVKIRIQSSIGSLGAFASGFETTLPDSLVAHWALEAVVDPQPDELGNYDLTEDTFTALNPTTVTGKVGNGISFDVSPVDAGGNYQSSADGLANIGPPWTILGWFRTRHEPTVGSYSTVVTRWPNTTFDDVFELKVREDTGAYALELTIRRDDTTTATYDTGLTITADTWHFFAISYGPDHYRIVLDTNDPVYIQDSIPEAREGTGLFTIGASPSKNGNGVNAFDEIRVYRRVVSLESLENIRAAEA